MKPDIHVFELARQHLEGALRISISNARLAYTEGRTDTYAFAIDARKNFVALRDHDALVAWILENG